MPHVMVMGGLVFDITYNLPVWPEQHDVIHTEDVYLTPGGKALNQAVAARRLGSEVTLVGCLGNDFLGDYMIQAVQEEAIDSQYICRDETVGTGVATMLVYKGLPGFIASPRASNRINIETALRAAKTLTPASTLLVNYEIPQEITIEVLKIAKAVGATTILNPAPPSLAEGHYLSLVDYVIPNAFEARMMLGTTENDLEKLSLKLLNAGAGHVCITLGESGSYYTDGKVVIKQPIYPVKAVDTTGASDAFCGAFAAGVAHKIAIESILQFASAAASVACTTYGTMPAMPTRAAVEAMLGKA